MEVFCGVAWFEKNASVEKETSRSWKRVTNLCCQKFRGSIDDDVVDVVVS